MKKLSDDAILFIIGLVFSWGAWATISIFASQKSEAVQDNKYENIISMLTEIKEELKTSLKK